MKTHRLLRSPAQVARAWHEKSLPVGIAILALARSSCPAPLTLPPAVCAAPVEKREGEETPRARADRSSRRLGKATLTAAHSRSQSTRSAGSPPGRRLSGRKIAAGPMTADCRRGHCK